MTLGECLTGLSNNPTLILGFAGVILTIIGVLHFVVGKEDAQYSPWSGIYSTLVYLVTIPGMAAVFFNIYLFLFERQPIMETNLMVQIVPIILMIVALFLIKINVSLRSLPGFGKLSSLILTISVVLALMWVLDKTRLIMGAFTMVPIQYVALIFIGLFLIVKFAMRRFGS